MRLSVSTKIFIGFAVVIIAFGSACAYTIYRMTTLRESVALMWEVMPVLSQLKDFSWRLRSHEKYLDLREPTDAQWLARLLPSLEPFDQIRRLEQRVEQLMVSPLLDDSLRARVEAVTTGLRGFREGPALAETLALVAPDFLTPDAATPMETMASEELYRVLVERTIARAAEGQLTASSREARSMVRAFRRINREVIEAAREVSEPIHELNERAAADEKAATVTVASIATGALLVSLVMLLVIRLTLRPILRLREGARRIAAGDYQERVEVGSRDEIGQLAQEFNTMAAALEARDRQLARQRAELLRKERLATIGKLAAQITHEVRNPLSSIGLNAELLEEELEGDEEQLALLAAIQAEVQRLKGITEEYLTYARLPKPDLAWVDVGQLVSGFLRFLTGELEAEEILLATAGVAAADAGGPAPILADADQVRQALLNLARNAIEALREVEPPRHLEVRLECDPVAGVAVVFVDNGAGVDPTLEESLFEPFVTGKSGGTGLGLALTQQIAVDHGGTVELAARPDGARGAVSSLRLPWRAQSQIPASDPGPVVDPVG